MFQQKIINTEKYTVKGNISRAEVSTIKALNKRLNVEVERPVVKFSIYESRSVNGVFEEGERMSVTMFCDSEATAYDVAEQMGNGSFVEIQGTIKEKTGDDGRVWHNVTAQSSDKFAVLKFRNKQ